MSSDMTARAREQRIAEIREREKKATKGPWTPMWVPSGMPAECCKYGTVGPDRDRAWILKLGKFRKALSEAGLHGHYNLFQQFFGETLESDLAQGQGVGPRCPKCGQLRSCLMRINATEIEYVGLVRCYACGRDTHLNNLEDFAQFFSPVPSPESATKEGKCDTSGK